MGTDCRRRSLASLKLTKEFHFRYLGLWVLLSVTLVIALNLVLYLLLQEHLVDTGPLLYGETLAGSASLLSQLQGQYLEYRDFLIVAMIGEAILISAGIVGLARVTSHRVAGPYIRLQRTFEQVRDGKKSVRLKFRSYDHLEALEESFAEMMVAVERRTGENGTEEQLKNSR